MSANVGVAAWLKRHPGSASVAVLIAPRPEPGKFATLCLGTTNAAETLIAALALLDYLADRAREQIDVDGSPQILARVERCREILSAELVA